MKSNSSSTTVFSLLTLIKKLHFVDELKIISKLTNMLNSKGRF